MKDVKNSLLNLLLVVAYLKLENVAENMQRLLCIGDLLNILNIVLTAIACSELIEMTKQENAVVKAAIRLYKSDMPGWYLRSNLQLALEKAVADYLKAKRNVKR